MVADTTYKRWNKESADAIYCYKLIIASNNSLNFNTFIKKHADWVQPGRYKKRNLRDNFTKLVENLKNFYRRKCTY